MQWLDVDKEGLRKLLLRRGGMSFVFFELLSNAWDTDATTVKLTTKPVPGKALVEIQIEDDDPNGFSDLAHSFTLFAESSRRRDPTRRGRFNLGEKLVLACCESAKVTSTKGTITFDSEGRHTSRVRTDKGTVFTGLIRMTREEYYEALTKLRLVIAPSDVVTTVNGERLQTPEKIKTGYSIPLWTELADEDGVLRRSYRCTDVEFYKPIGEKAWLYELGIPVVELPGGEPFSANVLQKIPLNTERDNVTTGYLKDIREAILNSMYDQVVGEEEASKSWVREASSAGMVSKPALAHVLKQRFGEKFVSQDPSDREAEKIAMGQGYTVVPGASMTKEEWENVKKYDLIQPAGRVTPSRGKAVSARWLTEEQLTTGMRSLKRFSEALGRILLDRNVNVQFCDQTQADALATWQDATTTLSFNISQLGEKWFKTGVTVDQLDVLIHEFGHGAGGGDHLSKQYNDALTRLGAKLAFYTSENPGFLAAFAWDENALAKEGIVYTAGVPFATDAETLF